MTPPSGTANRTLIRPYPLPRNSHPCLAMATGVTTTHACQQSEAAPVHTQRQAYHISQTSAFSSGMPTTVEASCSCTKHGWVYSPTCVR